MPGTAVVTDSTASLPGAEAERLHVTVVPLQVIVDGVMHREGVDLDRDEMAAAMTRGATVSTSRPTPADFLAVYEQVAAAGATEIVSLHISRKLSGTFDSARIAAQEAPVPVRVVDSGQVGMGLGFAVADASSAAAEGADAAETERVALTSARRVKGAFYVDSLDWLRRGGRVSAAAAVLGSALSVKPLLVTQEGAIVPLEKVRTTARAMARLGEWSAQAAGTGPCRVAVQHLSDERRAKALADDLRRRIPGITLLQVSPIAAVLGAHVGPGMLGVFVLPN